MNILQIVPNQTHHHLLPLVGFRWTKLIITVMFFFPYQIILKVTAIYELYTQLI